MADGVKGGNGADSGEFGSGAEKPGFGGAADQGRTSGGEGAWTGGEDEDAGMGDRFSAILPLILAMMSDGGRKRGMGAALQVQLLFWILEVVIDQLDATKGVMVRAKERLTDIDMGMGDKETPEDGSEW